MHVFTFLAAKYKAMMNPETNYGMEEAGMVQLDDWSASCSRDWTISALPTIPSSSSQPTTAQRCSLGRTEA